MKKAAVSFALSVVLCLFASIGSGVAAGNVPQKVLDLRKSVVRVLCQTSDGIVSGSGFAIGQDVPVNYIVTNLHVVESNTNGISILRANNREIKARAYLQLANADLCVLLLDEPLYDVPPVALYDKKPADVGQGVYALGFPGAADVLSDKATGDPEDVTITDGIVSAEKSLTIAEGGASVKLLQINAAISHGNSGGPLVDEDARVLGVNTYTVADSQNINGAISILELISSLKERGISYLSGEESKQSQFPWLTAGIVAGAAVLLGLAVLFVLLGIRNAARKRKAKAVPLPDYLKQWGGRLPYDTAAHVLAPALGELAALHLGGLVHADICPENIFIAGDANQANLRMPENAAMGGRLMLRPGFSSPEQYRADSRVGPWSDVYSICAVFYYMITGKIPLGVMERQALGGIGAIGFGAAAIGQPHASAILSGLALDAALRPQNAMELIRALGMPVSMPLPGTQAISMAASYPPAVLRQQKRKKMGVGWKLLIAGASVLFVLLAGAGGYYLYTDAKYNDAVACIAKHDYKGGIKNLSSVLRIYKSCDDWMYYACAGDELSNNHFEHAREMYKKLGDFNNASAMLEEVDYLQAVYILAEGNFQQAKDMFTSLGDYKDSAQMIIESDYQKAVSSLKNGDYDNAIETFGELARSKYKDAAVLLVESKYQKIMNLCDNKNYIQAFRDLKELGNYKDSANVMIQISDILYNEAIERYRIMDYLAAESDFKIIDPYKKSSSYLLLLSARNAPNNGYYSTMKDIYQHLTSLGTFEDAQLLRESDPFIFYRLQGNWHGGGYYFNLSFDKKKNSWNINYTLPWINGEYFRINDCTLMIGSDKKGWSKEFSFTFITENKMEVYCFKNGRTYTLTR